MLTQRDFDETPEAGDRFGWAVALSRFDDDCFGMLIGSPGEGVEGHPNAGMAHVFTINRGGPGDPAAFDLAEKGRSNLSFPSPTITEDCPGTPGSVMAGSRFGSSVAGLPATDVVDQRPGGYSEAVFAITSDQAGGSVYVISSDTSVAPRSWKPGSGGIPSVGVRFGQSVA